MPEKAICSFMREMRWTRERSGTFLNFSPRFLTNWTAMKIHKSQFFKASLLLFVFVSAIWCGHATYAQPSNGPQASPTANTDPPSADRPSLRPTRADDSFVIGPEDVLDISVWKEPELTKQIPVRSDGKISLPLLGDIQAAGRTPLQLQMDITDKLKGYVEDPQVAIIVQQINSSKYNVFGEVGKSGSYVLNGGTTIVDAIALAGGLKDFANKKKIYVLRINSAGVANRIAFNYEDFIKGKNTKQNILLKPRDTIVVP
jgi:polysaccharide export outer membrane protein